MDLIKLETVFKEIQKQYELPQYVNEICDSISRGNFNHSTVSVILSKYNKNHSVAKVDFLNLIFQYIKIALKDGILTKKEKENINHLKRVFQIQQGDFLFYNKGKMEKIIIYQLSKIYEDNYVTPDEALIKVDLQELFDLSFDQMNEYSKIESSISIQQGFDPLDLDVYFTNEEYFKIKNQTQSIKTTADD